MRDHLYFVTLKLKTIGYTYSNNILGFIEFEDKYDAEDAIKDLDDTKLCGERVKLELSKVPN